MKKKTMAELFEELRKINEVEPEMDELPPRTSRPVPYFEDLDDE